MKGTRILVSMLLAILLCSSTALAVSRDEAAEIAKQYVPEDCVLKDVDREGLSFEVRYDRASADERYEVTVKSISGDLVKVEREYKGRKREGDVKLTTDDVIAKLQETYPSAQALIAFLGMDDRTDVYQVLFADGDQWGLFEVGPESGMVFSSELYFEGGMDIAKAEYLSAEEIKMKVLGVSGGKIEEIKLEYDDGKLYYVGEVDTGLFDKAEFEVRPTDGRIVEWDD